MPRRALKPAHSRDTLGETCQHSLPDNAPLTKMELIHQAPTTSSFTPLAVHQSQTPESFYSGPPVLYHHSPSATLSLHASDLAAAPALSALANGARRGANGTAAVAVNGDGAAAEEEEEEDEDEEIEIPGVDVWVTSECVFLLSPRFLSADVCTRAAN